MPRPRLVPHYVNVEMPLVMNQDLPASAKVTYMYLKALSWGEDSIEFTPKEFNKLFGVPRATLYRHLSLLATSTVLRFGSPGNRTIGKIQIVFMEAIKTEGGSKTILDGISKMSRSYSSSSSLKDRDFKSQEEEEEDHNLFINNYKFKQESSNINVNENPKFEIPHLKNEKADLKIETANLKNEIPPLAADETDPNNETLPIPKEQAVSRNRTGPFTPDQDAATIFQHYEQNIGVLTPMIAEEIADALDVYPTSWIEEVILIAVTFNKRSWAYCRTILERWNREGKDDGGLKKGASPSNQEPQGAANFAKKQPGFPAWESSPSGRLSEVGRRLQALESDQDSTHTREDVNG